MRYQNISEEEAIKQQKIINEEKATVDTNVFENAGGNNFDNSGVQE